MTENLNIKYVRRMLHMAIYTNEVTLVNVDGMIHNTQKKHSSLVNLFSSDFFEAIHHQLNEKRSNNNLYLEDLKIMQKEFNLMLKQTTSTFLNDEEKEYETTLISAIAEISILISKLDMKMKVLFEKIGAKNAKTK